MNKLAAILTGLGVGAFLMYMFDPDRGTRRRALMRDKAVGLSNDLADSVKGKAKDLRNRAEGYVHEARSLMSNPEAGEETGRAV